MQDENIKLQLKETRHIPLLFVPCRIDFEEMGQECRLTVDQPTNVGLTRTGVEDGTQTNKIRNVSVATLLASAPVHDFSVQVAAPDIYDEYTQVFPSLGSCDRTSDSVLVMSRILNSNTEIPFFENTKALRDDPLSETVIYSFSPQIISSMFDERLSSYSVTAASENYSQNHLFAIGYAKDRVGVLTVWSLKNMNHAERLMRLPAPVTTLNFSKLIPHIVAVGLKNGQIFVIDIAPPHVKAIHEAISEVNSPVCCLQWWYDDGNEKEVLIYSVDNEVYCLRPPFFAAVPKCIMVADKASFEDDQVGLRGTDLSQSLIKGPAILDLKRVPNTKKMYLVGDSDGEIRLCSLESRYYKNILHRAHLGVVNSINYSPHNPKIYLSCGADGLIRVWSNDASEPLLELATNQCGANITNAIWSPTHATIVIGAMHEFLCVWDIRRKVATPLSSMALPDAITTLHFVRNGQFILLGLQNGTLQLLGMKGFPFPEFFKAENLVAALQLSLEENGKEHLIPSLFK